MPMPSPTDKRDLLPGTLEMLVLKSLSVQPMHGYAIARHIERLSQDVLKIEEGSLYPALQRMAADKWLRAEWGTTDSGRKARFYTITPAGRRQLVEEEQRWGQLTDAVNRALRFA